MSDSNQTPTPQIPASPSTAPPGTGGTDSHASTVKGGKGPHIVVKPLTVNLTPEENEAPPDDTGDIPITVDGGKGPH